MKNIALGCLALACLFPEALCGWFQHVQQKKTWLEARDYCREHHTDLPSISNQEEEDNFRTVTQGWSGTTWLSLYKDANGTWKWSGGKNASFFNWARNPSDDTNKCVVLKKRGWVRMDCEVKRRFLCFHSEMVVVKENKTWEEAMERCRSQYGDLVSLTSESALVETVQTSREAQTDHVWTGLRYLADTWLWVNGDNVNYQAWSQRETPHCPGLRHRCGALSLQRQQWESRDCAEKLNFVCDKNT